MPEQRFFLGRGRNLSWLSRPFSSLRPFLFALVWLGVCEAFLRLYFPPDEGVLQAPLPPYGCAADDELVRLVAARARASSSDALDVVLIGDSVLASVENRYPERLADLLAPSLSQALSGRAVHVYNLSMGGARAADVYGALRRMVQRLDAQPRRLRDLVVVLSSNVIFFSRRHSQPAMLYPCLLDEVPDQAGLRARLHLPPPPRPVERSLAGFLSRHLYLYQQRRRIAELLFGGPPRPMLRERLQQGFHRRQTTQPSAIDYTLYAPNYDFIPLNSADAVNYQLSLQLAHFLGTTKELQSLVVLTPHNHARLGAITATASYRTLSSTVADMFQKAGASFVSYDHDVEMTSDMFLDLDHLTGAGNKVLADRLARDVARVVAGAPHPVDTGGAAVR